MSDHPRLTAFQIDADQAISELLVASKQSIDSREIRKGVMPFYSPDEQVAIKIVTGSSVIWLFDDEASFSGPHGGTAFERDDFASEADLLSALLGAIRHAVNGVK